MRIQSGWLVVLLVCMMLLGFTVGMVQSFDLVAGKAASADKLEWRGRFYRCEQVLK